MSTDRAIQVRGIKVQVVRKAIKNLHLGVYPPNGRVRVAAPMAVSNDAVRLAVIGKLGWIGRQRRKFLKQPRQSKREMVSGESHYFLGRRYRLRVIEFEGSAAQGVKKRPAIIELNVRAGAATHSREAVLDAWYREKLREVAGPLMEKWQRKLGVEAADWGIKRMKTKWGACNAEARRVWLNLELVKSPPECIEYIVVHELVHLVARAHDERFFALMDRHLPGWRARRELLNSSPLPHVVWPC
ncbi:MAG: M48 family metallopeptidase [Myxococcaceae bacterium]|jgi:predicted metal-dependent hydrolase|nr:M48 family metallopeptidase [Myxococcaceae bacterium]MCA3016545.1 M48 family metallopeptidase [Myxococcaceae bacterium]